MKRLLFALIALVAMTANAQNGVSNPYRFGQGEDSVRCIQSISIMNTNVKNKDYKIAYDAWKVLFDEFPVARVDTYTNGIKILNEFISKESDPQKKEDYINELMSIYDQQFLMRWTSLQRILRETHHQLFSRLLTQSRTQHSTITISISTTICRMCFSSRLLTTSRTSSRRSRTVWR